MSKDNTVIAGEIISALHDELYRAYYPNKDFTKPFGNSFIDSIINHFILFSNILRIELRINLHKFDN